MKIVYLGTDAVLPCFTYLLEKHEIMALYICGNSDDYFRATAISRLAEEHGIPVHTETIDIKAEKQLIKDGCELFLSADYGRKIPVLSEFEGFYGLNIHYSMLPEGRSYCPIECALERGEKVSGVTIHKLVEEFDKGDILEQTSIPITPEDDSIDLYLKSAEVARTLLDKVLRNFKYSWESADPQQVKGSYWRLKKMRDARLSHDMTVAEVKGIYRIYNRLTRIKTGDDVWFIKSLETGTAKLDTEILTLGDEILYSLSDGHARLILEKADHPEEVWESEKYPFSFKPM